MAIILTAYLAIGSVLALVAGTAIGIKYRDKVFLPAAAIHGDSGVAVGQDALILYVVCAAIVVGWLPIALLYAYAKLRNVTGRQRSRDNNPTPVL